MKGNFLMEMLKAIRIIQNGQKLCNHRSASYVFRQLIFDLERSNSKGNRLVVGILEHQFTQNRFKEVIANIKYLASFENSITQIERCSELDRLKVLYVIHTVARRITNLTSGSSDGRLFNLKTGNAVSRSKLQKYLKQLSRNLKQNFSMA